MKFPSFFTKDRMTLFRLRRIPITVMVGALLPLQACALSSEPIEGKVLEEGTNRPITGAMVVVRWVGRTTSTLSGLYVESRDMCYHVETALTDTEGSYRTSAWKQEQQKNYSLKFDHFSVDAYKPSYGIPTAPSQKREVFLLKPFTGTREERLRAVWSSGVQCGSAGESRKNLIPLYRALHEEAMSLAQSQEGKKIVNALQNELEKLESGNDATKRIL